jgi:hypothetical protein
MADGKPPAYQCYARDALTTTSAMTLAETGVWAKLRWWTWMNGPVQLERLHIILGVTPGAAKKYWAVIEASWARTPEGWVAPDLETQRQSLRSFHEAQAAKAAAGGRARAEALRRARGHSPGSAPGLPAGRLPGMAGDEPAGLPGAVPGTLPEVCPRCAPALCSCSLQDPTQIQEDQPLRGPSPAENDNPRVLLKLAHTVLDEQKAGAFADTDIEEVFERRAARLQLNYAGDRTRKALESAQKQRAMGKRA